MELALRREGQPDHRIIEYWGHLRDADVADRRARDAIAELEPYVLSLSRIDDDGQQLRYFENQAGDRSLGDLAVVNLPHIRESVERLGEILSILTGRVDVLEQEHHTGTRTTRCSRTDLVEIASILGDHKAWSEDAFLQRKERVMDRFGLTRKAFSNAVDAIRGSRHLAATVGIENALTHLGDEKALAIARLWLAANPPPAVDFEVRIVNPADLGFAAVKRHGFDQRELMSEVADMTTIEEFADVETVFYIGRDNRFGEEYAAELSRTVREHAVDRSRLAKVGHIVSKTNLLDGLIAGLARVGRPSLARQLEDLREQARAPAAPSSSTETGDATPRDPIARSRGSA